MAIIDTLKVYESLKNEMPDRSAKAVAEALERSFEEYRMNQREFLATKQEMTEFRAAVKEDMTAMRKDIAAFQAATKVDFAGIRAEMIKWMFIFWVGQVGVLATFLLALR
ncbi:MAG: hypothetical protein A2Z34_03030 [Planctomycetes bacterium RBG_16_59_8]|nr:MAG: hypothetical protein A2Z34_03030 [Planctomycetes bacterium RBG_16_59_8]